MSQKEECDTSYIHVDIQKCPMCFHSRLSIYPERSLMFIPAGTWSVAIQAAWVATEGGMRYSRTQVPDME